MRAFALERENRVDHVLDHPWTGNLPVLGDMPDQHHGRARALGVTDKRLRAGADLGDGAGGELDHVSPHGLDEIDYDQARRLAFGEGRGDVLDRGLGGKLDRSIRQPEPFRAQADLCDRFLARDVDRALAGAGKRRRDLDQQRRLADAGIAAEQEDRAAHEAAAGDAIELRQSRCEARGVVRRSGQRFECELAALARRPAGRRWPRRCGVLLRDRVPLVAGVALALPAAIDRAAILADEAGIASRHGWSHGA